MGSLLRSPSRTGVATHIDPDLAPLDAPSQPRTLRSGIVATIVGLLLFLFVQGLLAVYELHVVREAVDRGLLVPSSWDRLSVGSRLLPAVLGGGVSYLTFALVGSAIAGRGHRLVFALPALGYVLAAVVLGPDHVPEAIGAEWRLDCYSARLTCAEPWFGHPWFGPVVDLALVLVPGWVVERATRPRRSPERIDPAAVAAILASAAAVATAGWAIAVIQRHLELRELVAVGLLGMALGVARPWWPWLHVVFATYAAGSLGFVVEWIVSTYPGGLKLRESMPYLIADTWPLAAIGLIASAWQPLAWATRKLLETPVRLLIAVNVLNVVDAVMTLLAVRSGGALESNPVIRFAGLPAKVVLVGLLTGILYRRKPSALVWPGATLLWVACYHVAGILVNDWR